MKKKCTYFFLILFLLIACILVCTLSLNACSQKDRDDNTKIYSDEEIYLKSWECGYLGQFPHFPVIIETEEQLAYAEQYYNLHEISDVFKEMISQYPIEQYTYMILYHDTSPGAYYHADRVEIGDDFISFGMDKKSHGPKDRAVPAVIVGFIHTAAIPKEYMKECDFSGMMVVIPGEVSQTAQPETESAEETAESGPEVLQQRVLAESGFTEDAILMMDYDDYDRDGKCEAFMFCGEVLANQFYEEKGYNGELWFVGEKQCTLLRKGTYRMIDGSMTLGPNQKYLYLYSDRVFTANISELWTVIDGEPVEDELSGLGQIVYRGGDSFEIWIDGYDHFYNRKNDLWTGHTYRPYFYEYNWSTGTLERYAEKTLSDEELAELCGFDLAAEVRAEGYEITEIVQWGGRIVTVNYTLPPDPDENALYEIVYENIIWDCSAKDYWRSEERGVTSWRDAGVGGSF